MTEDETDIIDRERTCNLGDVGGTGYIAATAVSPDGTSYLVLARSDAIGENVRYYPTCRDVAHEQLGKLPAEYIRRITPTKGKDR